MERITAAASEAAQRRIAGGLERLGARRGDRIAVVAQNNIAVLSLALGALRRGVVPVMLNAALLPQERDALIADSEPKLVVDDAMLAALADGPAAELAPWPLARPMHYTSGTTGAPKGVWSGILDDDAAAALIAEEREQWAFTAGDVHLVCSPLAHSAPLRFSMGTLLAGGAVLLLDHFEAEAAAAAIAGERPTTTFMVPAHFQRLFALKDLPSMDCFRLVAHAGAPCPENLKRRALEVFPPAALWEFYGSTEGQFTVCSSDEWRAHPGTVGRARRYRQLSADGDGLLWCRVPPYARFEYFRAPEKTAKTWRGDEFTVGDLGEIDADGYVFLSGRRDDLIISGGVNVYPAEVERVLGQMAGIEEVVVFPIADERWGQRVCAAVVGGVGAEAVKEFARVQLASYKRPKDVFIVESIPLTGRGKVLRSKLATALGLEGC